ncbi:MAG: hypothetical protein AABZ08_07570 [Planctomycetota bacterium]
MPTEHVQHVVKHHRPALLIGAIVGLLLIGGFVMYEFSSTPTTPIPTKASAAEMVDFIANDRGMVKLPDVQQKQLLDEWQRHLNDPKARDELKVFIKDVNEDTRKAFLNALLRQIKKSFLDDAKKFASLTTAGEKNAHCRQKLIEGRDQALQFKDLAVLFKTNSGTRTDDMQQWVMENTTAEERAIGEPYVDALKRIREQVKKEERAPTTAATEKKKP